MPSIVPASETQPALLNRELSLLKFNERVLAMAEYDSTPLLERLRYICIVSSNLDEFFEIRISSLKEQLALNAHRVGPDGYTPGEAFDRVQLASRQLVEKQYSLLTNQILPLLAKEGIGLTDPMSWSEEQRLWAHEIFMRDVMPLLTPIGLDPAHPFPRVFNKSLNFIVALSGEDAFGRPGHIAIVQAPRALPRVIRMPPEVAGIPHGFILLSTLISEFVGELFPGLEVDGCYQWRVTRNSDLFVDEEEITNLRLALQGELSQRNFGAAVRLEVDHVIPQKLVAFLQQEFLLEPHDTYKVNGPVNLSRLMQVCNLVDRPEVFFPDHRPRVPSPFADLSSHPSAIFDIIGQKDYLLHHPYQSFQPVLDFLVAAARDPDVVAIKQTIYRTGEDSELMAVLLAAAKAGKEVTVVVELMARFDEQTNINWASRLEEVGAHVSYGVVGHKTHAKMALVLRREKGHIRRYGHLGTGNYHMRTTRLYTDFGLLTANPRMCEDMDKVIALIQREAEHAKAGKKASIKAKMNSLLERQVIDALYQASQAGVKVDLVVRGACALRAGVPGLSENIRLRSIVGRFLEHSRVFYFHDDGAEHVYLSSADWMDRNFFRRVEVAFPVLDKVLKKRVISESFSWAMRDNQLAWRALPNGAYQKVKGRGRGVNMQNRLMALLGK